MDLWVMSAGWIQLSLPLLKSCMELGWILLVAKADVVWQC